MEAVNSLLFKDKKKQKAVTKTKSQTISCSSKKNYVRKIIMYQIYRIIYPIFYYNKHMESNESTTIFSKARYYSYNQSYEIWQLLNQEI